MDPTVTDEAPPPPPYQPPPIGPRRLERSSGDRMLAGVCGGVADYLGVDPTLVRIGAVLLTVAGGVGIVAYGVAWLLVPSDDGTDDVRPGPWQAILIVLGAFIVLGWFKAWDGGPALSLALLAIGAVLVWGGHEGSPSAPRPSARVAAAPAPPPPDTRVVPIEQTGPGRWSWSPPPPPAVEAPPPRRAPRQVGRAIAVGTGGLLLAAGAITGAIAASGHIAPTAFLGCSLAAFGFVIAVGSRWGWSRPLAWGAMSLVLALALASVVDVPLHGGIGDRTVQPFTLAELPAEVHQSVGHLTLDLSLVPFAGDERHVEATLAVGELEVLVPAGTTVEVHAQAGVGQVEVFEQLDDGVSAEADGTYDGIGPGRVELDLEVGIGRVVVRRGS